MKANEPKTLEELIEQMTEDSKRHDLSDEYLLENGHSLRNIGEYSYGISMTPTDWSLKYLLELKSVREELKSVKEELEQFRRW